MDTQAPATSPSAAQNQTRTSRTSLCICHCKDYTSLPEQQGVLLRFDLSSVPRNAQIGGATLSVATYDRNITDDLVVSLHVLSRTWEASQATWNRPAVAQSWGAAGANDGWYDRRENWESYAVFDINLPPQAWNHWDIKDAVQYWVEQPQWNHGAKLQAYIGQLRNVSYDAYSSEAANVEDRPKIIITYTVDPAIPIPTDVPPTPTQTPTRVPSEPIQTAVFQQGLNGYYGAADTELNRRLPDINTSQTISLHLRWQDKEVDEQTQQLVFVDRDEYNPILYFDVSSIPSNALVTAATLQLYPFYQSNPSYIIASTHMILRDWDVAEATWNQAANGLPWFDEGCGCAQLALHLAQIQPEPIRLSDERERLGGPEWRQSLVQLRCSEHGPAMGVEFVYQLWPHREAACGREYWLHLLFLRGAGRVEASQADHRVLAPARRANGHAHCHRRHAHQHAHGNGHVRSDVYSHGHELADAKPHGDENIIADRLTHDDTVADDDRHIDRVANTKRHGVGYGYGDGHADSDRHRDPGALAGDVCVRWRRRRAGGSPAGHRVSRPL